MTTPTQHTEATTSALIARVREAVQRRNVRRLERVQRAAELSPSAFYRSLTALRARIDGDLEHAARESPFSVLSDAELGVLERQLAAYTHAGRLQSFRGERVIELPLLLVRANRVAQSEQVTGAGFRAALRCIYREALHWTCGFLQPQAIERSRAPVASDLVVVVPWRSGFLAAEEWVRMGARAHWPVILQRRSDTLTSMLISDHPPPRATRSQLHLVTMPVVATGQATVLVIERLLEVGVPESRIAVQAIVAAPEGIDRVLMTFPQVRLVAAAIDERLDAFGCVDGPGIGDVDALAMRGIDAAYVDEHWVGRRLLDAGEVDVVLDRPSGVPDATPCAGAVRTTDDAPKVIPERSAARDPDVESVTLAPVLDQAASARSDAAAAAIVLESMFFGGRPLSWAELVPDAPAHDARA